MFFVYVIRSINFNFLYKGHTADLKSRIKEHTAGNTKSIKAYKPFELLYIETYKTRDVAVKREKYLKTGSGREFLKKN